MGISVYYEGLILQTYHLSSSRWVELLDEDSKSQIANRCSTSKVVLVCHRADKAELAPEPRLNVIAPAFSLPILTHPLHQTVQRISLDPLAMADALCGPSNALQNFQKHTTVDRTLQQDRFTSRPQFEQVNQLSRLLCIC